MRALFRNLIVACVLVFSVTQAKAVSPAAAVVWTFSGVQFSNLFTYPGSAPIQLDNGTVTGFMAFNATGTLVDFKITTAGGAFGYTYQYGINAAYTPVTNGLNPGSWGFQTGTSFLNIKFVGLDPSIFPSGWGPIAPRNLDANNTFELGMYNSAQVIRIGSSAGNITATRIPEPASMALLGTALFGMGAAMRRRNRRSA